VEHPEQKPLIYQPCDPVAALADFEKLLVETQACRIHEMRWLVAMNAGFFPYVRDDFPARLIQVIKGPRQNGKPK
jgi:hypothetical protein